jgi:hypothetical protein
LIGGMRTVRIISGGQTGVDRAALDFAIENGIAYGGWCPKGGWAEDMPNAPGVLESYPQLRETPDRDPKQRTEWNVRDSGASLIVARPGVASAGTAFTIDCAKAYAKPYVVVDPLVADAPREVLQWLRSLPNLPSLNIAGPRESESPGIYAAARTFLEHVLT